MFGLLHPQYTIQFLQDDRKSSALPNYHLAQSPARLCQTPYSKISGPSLGNIKCKGGNLLTGHIMTDSSLLGVGFGSTEY